MGPPHGCPVPPRVLSQPYPRPVGGSLSASGRKEGSLSHSSFRSLGQHTGLSPTSSPSSLIPNFSTLGNTFEVEIKRNSLGLGFSICGGGECGSPWGSLMKIKKIFPLQPAWETGKLKVGDIILRVSGIPLAGLNLRQALDILRTSPTTTLLQVCRVSDPQSIPSAPDSPIKNGAVRPHVVRSYSYGPQTYPDPERLPLPPCKKLSDPTPTPHNHNPPSPPFSVVEMDLSTTHSSGSQASSGEWSPGPEEAATLDILRPVENTLRNSAPAQGPSHGEFRVTLTKVNGSLGFTLRQLDDTVLKHTIKALVREPAISDGRLRPGDKLLAANSVELGSLSHAEVVQFLRQAPDTVQLTLYRDDSRAQTPLTPETGAGGRGITGSSSTGNMAAHAWAQVSGKGRMSSSPSRKHLRYEAAELVRSLQSSRTSLERAGLGGSVGSLHTPATPHTGTHTLGRRLQARGASPRVAPGQRHLLQGSTSPRVESPGSASAPPSLITQGLSQALSSMELDSEPNLVIEEIDGFNGSPVGGLNSGLVSLPQSPLVSSPNTLQCPGYFYQEQDNKTKSLPRGRTAANFFQGTGEFTNQKVERPGDLNLNGQTRKQAFMFNNNWNANQF